MNSFEEVKDIKLNTYLSVENEGNDKLENVGSKSSDFEIIKLLGNGSFGAVYKVISKINKKIYAMKKVDLAKLKGNSKAMKLALNESKYLTVLSHPHIMKYYTSFTEGDYLYLIIENAENGDLENFILSNKKMGRFIPEDELWSIFLQCMQGLVYVHKMGVIHRDIKLANILMDNNMTIKLGDFGTCAVKRNNEKENENIKYLNAEYRNILNQDEMKCNNTQIISEYFAAEEMIKEVDYDQKVDVYSMGVTFYYMCYHRIPKKGVMHNNTIYSKEMLDIVNEMLESDKDKRKSSDYFLERINNEFSKRYYRNTSIDAIVRCLYSFDELTKFYIQKTDNELKDKPITNAYVKCLKNMTEKDINSFFESIKYFREILCTENAKFDKTNEINPKLVLAFLLTKLHQEINFGNVTWEDEQNNYYMKSGLEDALTSKLEMLLNFENKLFSQLNSLISRKLVGILQKSFICNSCKIKTYSFGGYFYITLDLEKIPNQYQINMENYFTYRNNSFNYAEKYCPKCLTKTQHAVNKKFFTSPDNLIVTINRGSNDLNKRSVILSPIIDLTNLTVSIGRRYKLVGFITKNYENEKYISYLEFRKTGKWFKSEDMKINEIKQDELIYLLSDINGQTMMAFYEAI